MMLLSPLFLAVVFAVLLLFYLARCISSPLWEFQGPAISRLTSLVLRWHEFHANRTLYIHSLHLKYGPVVRIAPNELSFTSYEAVKEIYGSLGSGYDKTDFYNMFTVLGRRTMFSTLDKVNHAKRKRIIADRYANSNVMRPIPLSGIEERAQEFVKQCQASTGSSLDVYIKLHSYACDCATHHLLHPYGTDSLQNGEDRKMMHQVTTDNSLQNRLIQYHSPVFHRCLSRVLNLFAEPREIPLANNFIMERSKMTDSARFTLLSRLHEKSSSELDGLDIAAECLDHMVAGIDTTGDALCFLMWELSQPASFKFQKRLQQELRDDPSVPFDKLPYLDAVVQEGLRCFPAIPMSLPRIVPQGGKTIAGYFVPENTTVSSQAYSVHRYNASAFPEPDLFNPERWIASTGDAERKRHMFAFSHGGRGCVGKHLALAEMKTLLRGVYSRFTTLPDASMTPDSMRPHDQVISARPFGQMCLLRFAPIVEEQV